MYKDSLERIYPSEIDTKNPFEKNVLDLHLERYRFASRYITGRRVLDIACGVGYGTAILYDACGGCAEFLGIDINEEAIEYAKKHYARPTIEFCATDVTKFKDYERFDTIVSIETIEHLPDPSAFVEYLAKLLSAKGVIVASVPTTPSLDGNPYHLHDFTERTFCKLFERHGLVMGPVLRQTQAFSPISLFSENRNQRLQNVRQNLIRYYFKNPFALLKRLLSILRFGFSNRYMTAVWIRKD